MRYSPYKWNVELTINGITGIPDYYGYRSREMAEIIAQRYRLAGFEAKVIRYS